MRRRGGTVTVVRQAVLRYTIFGKHYQHVAKVSPYLLPIAIPFVDHINGGFGQVILKHQPGDLTVSGLPVYR